MRRESGQPWRAILETRAAWECPIWDPPPGFSSPARHDSLSSDRMRTATSAFLLSVALGAVAATGGVAAQESRLPDIGSSAGSILSPAQQAEYGAMTLSPPRNY